MEYGAITLIPPLAMLLFALFTKKSFEALIVGTLVAYIIMYGAGFIEPWCDMLLDECSNPDNQYILMVCGMFGGLIFILREVKGTLGFSNVVNRMCKSQRMAKIIAFVLGILIFLDDYLNIMTVGTCMKDVFDKKHLPRQSLAYIIDSTGAPVCALVPFSTWVVFYSGLFIDEPVIQEMGFTNGMDVYMSVIPFMFYPICALSIVFLFAVGIIPPIGPMKTAYNVFKQSQVKAQHAVNGMGAMGVNMEGAGVMNVRDVSPAIDPIDIEAKKQDGNIWDFILPIAVLISVTLFTQNMLISIICTLASCLVFYIPRKKITFTRLVELFWEGFADILPVLGILLASFMIRRVCSDMALPEYVIYLAEPLLNAHLMAAVIFVIIAILTFVTSSFWGIEAIAISIVAPLAVAMDGNVMLILGAVVSGGVFGSHACFYSDATVLSSATCDIDNISHATTQLPYVLIGAVAATICFLIAGFCL